MRYLSSITKHSVNPNFLLITLLLLASSLPIACNKEIKVNDSDIIYISRKEMQKQLDKKQSKKHPIIIIDPRSEDEYIIGHITGAINIPLPEAKKDDPKLKEAKDIFIYGRYGEDPLAKAMCKKLLAFGYDQVRMYKGGLEEWQAREQPMTSGDKP